NFTGVALTGVATNDQAGFAIAGAGNANGATQGPRPINDLLIGAPQIASNGAGVAYLLLGGTNLPLGSISSLSTVGSTIAGATFNGLAAGSETGFALSTAGDFNGDKFGDFMIGSPGAAGNTGRVDLIFGQAAGSTSTLTGTIN